MAVNKGFVYTLEAVIAASLFLGMVILFIPSVEDQAAPEQAGDTVRSALESLDKAGEIRDNLTVSEIEDIIDPYVTSGYSHNARITFGKRETERFDTSGEKEFQVGENGDHAELQFWIKEASGLNATYKGEKLIDRRESSGYVEKTVEPGQGYLKFNGTGTGRFTLLTYEKQGDIPDEENLGSVDYVVESGNFTEVRISLWQN